MKTIIKAFHFLLPAQRGGSIIPAQTVKEHSKTQAPSECRKTDSSNNEANSRRVDGSIIHRACMNVL